MKRNNIIVYLFSGVTLFSACHDLDFGRWMKKVIPIGLTIRFIVKI